MQRIKKAVILLTALISAAAVEASMGVLPDPVGATASSEYDSNYSVANLYDGSVTAADIGTSANLGAEYAGLGAGNHVVVYDMGATVTFNAILYAQRSAFDPVGGIEFWVTDTDPGDASYNMSIINGGIIADVTLTNVSNNNLSAYELGGSASGRYVVMRLNNAGGQNPGGYELVLGYDDSLPTNTLSSLEILDDPVSATASSAYPGFTVASLYDGTVGVGDIGTSDNMAWDYAGHGAGPHVVVYDMGASVTFNAVVYAQRIADFVGEIEFWVTNIDPGAAATDMAILNGETVSDVIVTNVSNYNLTQYELGGSASGRYVVMRLNNYSSSLNPGGFELVLGFDSSAPTAPLVLPSDTLVVLADPVGATASSTYPGFTVASLYDGTVDADDIGTPLNQGSQYAAIGAGPHVVVYDMGASVTFNALVYAQRNPADAVGEVEFWITDTDPGAAASDMAILNSSKISVVTVWNVDNTNLTAYELGGSTNGQYVVMRLNAAGGGNIGGAELLFGFDSSLPTNTLVPISVTTNLVVDALVNTPDTWNLYAHEGGSTALASQSSSGFTATIDSATNYLTRPAVAQEFDVDQDISEVGQSVSVSFDVELLDNAPTLNDSDFRFAFYDTNQNCQIISGMIDLGPPSAGGGITMQVRIEEKVSRDPITGDDLGFVAGNYAGLGNGSITHAEVGGYPGNGLRFSNEVFTIESTITRTATNKVGVSTSWSNETEGSKVTVIAVINETTPLDPAGMPLSGKYESLSGFGIRLFDDLPFEPASQGSYRISNYKVSSPTVLPEGFSYNISGITIEPSGDVTLTLSDPIIGASYTALATTDLVLTPMTEVGSYVSVAPGIITIPAADAAPYLTGKGFFDVTLPVTEVISN